MAELRLRRDPDDRKRYVIDGVGELRTGKWHQRGATVTSAAGDGWELKPSSNWRNRYALWSGESELASVETTGWSGQEVAVDVSDDTSVEPLLLLMACYLVRRFGEDAAAAAGGATAAAG